MQEICPGGNCCNSHESSISKTPLFYIGLYGNRDFLSRIHSIVDLTMNYIDSLHFSGGSSPIYGSKKLYVLCLLCLIHTISFHRKSLR